MGLRRKEKAKQTASVVQTGGRPGPLSSLMNSYVPLGTPQNRLYYALRESVPIIDAAIFKLIRLTGGFSVQSKNTQANQLLNNFVNGVNVGGNRLGLDAFISSYFEQLLTCGTAVGEIVLSRAGKVGALYNAPLSDIELKRAQNGLDVDICLRNGAETARLKRPDLVFLSVLNPEPGALGGCSLLKGLPFVSSVLLKIYESTGANWERVGNVRFAVTYKPQNDVADRAFARERALEVAREWGEAMQVGGSVKDFVAVGDVQIRVIGADNQILDSEVPVRQMLEQIVAKTGLPPFMLGLSWSSTERMSSQQADSLTSELEYYRRILTPVILKICKTYLRLEGYPDEITVAWDDITLQDQVEIARAELFNAQAASLKKE